MRKIIFFEIVLMFSSVLIFRSFWALLDREPWFSTNAGLAFALTVGLIFACWSLRYLNRCVNK